MAARDRSLRESVCRRTARTPHDSKAWPSISSLASVLTGVRWAAGPSQVWPMLARSRTPSWGSGAAPGSSAVQSHGSSS